MNFNKINTAIQASKAETLNTGEYPKALFFKPKGGTNTLRILPEHPVKNPDGFTNYTIHWGVGDYPVMCELSRGKANCCIHEVFEAVRANTDPLLAELAAKISKSIRPVNRWVFNVIDRKNEALGPQVWEITAYSLRDALLSMFKLDPQYTDINEGRDFSFNFTGKKYDSYDSSDKCPLARSPALAQQWIDSQANLIAMMKRKEVETSELEELITTISGIDKFIEFE
jgi:hypothetical protein